MTKNLDTQVTVVIRSANERTTQRCADLIARQISPDNIVVIHEAPFTEAVRRTFQVGIERALPWTLAVDADVLVRSGAIARLVELGENAPPNLFKLQGRILDKLFQVERYGCPHLFRTEFLEKALAFLPADKNNLRPETHVVLKMVGAGFSRIQVDHVFGLHDYEQYYHDIYRKTFVHAQKHARRLPYFEALWSRLAAADSDFQVALWGLRMGSVYKSSVAIDVRSFPDQLDHFLSMYGLAEKDDLPAAAIPQAAVDELLESFRLPKEYWIFRELMDDGDGIPFRPGRFRRFRLYLMKAGAFYFFPYLLSVALTRAGTSLQKQIMQRRLPPAK